MNSLSKPALSLAGVQWLFFMFANTVVVPLSVGAAFELPDMEIAGIIRTSFIVTGAASILQAVLGHKYPLMEGHGGVWWGLVLSLCASAPAVGLSYAEVGGSLALGIILAGIMTILLGAFGFAGTLKKLFNPIVLTVYLFLLSCQLIMVFFKGMLGIDEEGKINAPIAMLSIGIVVLVLVLATKGFGKLGNYSILIGMMVGWIAHSLLITTSVQVSGGSSTLLPFLPWGAFRMDIGIVLTAFLAGLINMANSLVAITTIEKLLKTKTSARQYRSSFILTGFHTIIAGLFGLIPYGPYTSSIGFLESTRIYERLPFIIGGSLFIVMGLVPMLGSFFSMMPTSIGDAVLFVAYLQLFGNAVKNIRQLPLEEIPLYRLTIPALVGLSVMTLTPVAFSVFPVLVQPIISNGLLVGVLLSLIMEISSKKKVEV
ncbi:uracil/xanthine transporter [Sporosarcina sp. SAFN-015]|uniref:uracil/xanthine transporter n=1 Tax=Sporosarcina sp. SAFN-015 TaxID=3387274 RepID=UPI003F7E15C7